MLQTQMLKEALKQLGINENQIKIYLELTKLGTAPASAIAKRTGIPRTTVKYGCQQLVNKNLIVEVNQNNGSYYSTKNPENLRYLIQVEKDKLETKEQALNEVIAQLGKLQHEHLSMPKVVYYQGVDGIIEMLEDILHYEGEFYCALKISETYSPAIMKYQAERYIPLRIEKGNKVHAIFNDNELSRKYKEQDKEMNRHTVLIDETQFPIDICYHIYGSKVAFYSMDEKDLSGVIIDNPLIAKSQLSLFQLAYDRAKALEDSKTK